MRSTIITFSARFFAEPVSSARCAAATASSGLRAQVPLIGLVSTVPPVRRRNNSGDMLATAPPGGQTNAAYGGFSSRTPRRKRSAGSPSKSASIRSVMFAWKMSPRRIRPTAARTASAWAQGSGPTVNSPHW